jgi:hypothetical protein
MKAGGGGGAISIVLYSTLSFSVSFKVCVNGITKNNPVEISRAPPAAKPRIEFFFVCGNPLITIFLWPD